VRELENTIERAINLAGDDPLLRAEYFELTGSDAEPHAGSSATRLQPLDEVEQVMIRRAIAFHKGNIQKAAASLGISRNTLYRKIKEYGADDAAFYPCGSETSDHLN
jgi:transcriptional regulator with PAS, ATPase and Fis domain